MVVKKKNASGLFIFLAAMLLVVTLSARVPLDADMWWHIRSGEMTVKQGAPLLEDVFSFTRYGAEWTNHSWLSQVVLFLAFQLAGFHGLAIYTALLAAVSMGLVYRLIEGAPLFKAFLIILCSSACALVWTPRPQMFSLAFFALLLNLLADYKSGKSKRLWLVPILFALWSNMHGGFPIGLALLAVYTVAESANRVFFYEKDVCLSWTQIRGLLLWSLSAIPAVLLNPNGIKTWLIPFQTVGITALQNLIQEWASPDFHELPQQVILWLLFLMVISFSMAGRRIPLGDLLVPLTFAYMTLLARRNIAAFAMTAVPATSRGLLAAWGSWRGKLEAEGGISTLLKRYRLAVPIIRNRQVDAGIARVVNLVIIALLSSLAFGRLGIMSLQPVVDRNLSMEYPVEAVNWMQQQPVTGNVLNEYNWGGYLVFSNPANPVFVDGRTDLFGDEIIGEWQQVVLGEPEWLSILDKWEVQAVLLKPDKPLLAQMNGQGWRKAFEDEKSVVMVRE
jgi:hypothetical protein